MEDIGPMAIHCGLLALEEHLAGLVHGDIDPPGLVLQHTILGRDIIPRQMDLGRQLIQYGRMSLPTPL